MPHRVKPLKVHTNAQNLSTTAMYEENKKSMDCRSVLALRKEDLFGRDDETFVKLEMDLDGGVSTNVQNGAVQYSEMAATFLTAVNDKLRLNRQIFVRRAVATAHCFLSMFGK